MKLEKPFYKLPVRFDVERLREEISQFSEDEWRAHPSNYAGNSAIPLISAGGESNDDMAGSMLSTPALERCSYIRQVLASFDTVWGRSRLMRLAPGENVPPHNDVHYYWFNRTRIHIPIVTHPDIRFECEDSAVHMAMGEAWTFDNWRMHQVINPTDVTRIHLTADTTGSAAFWELIKRSPAPPFTGNEPEPRLIPFRPNEPVTLRTERFNIGPVLHPAEVDLLLEHLLRDIDVEATKPETCAALLKITKSFRSDWRSIWSEFGDSTQGYRFYKDLRDRTRDAVNRLEEPVPLKSTGISALSAFKNQILNSVFNPQLQTGAETRPESGRPPQVVVMRQRVLDRPVFIVAAPRSGSTLLFETLAEATEFWTIGGESHNVFEGLPQLRPGAEGVDSNRLTAGNADPETAKLIRWTFARLLQDRNGERFNGAVQDSLRMLEKTPKNALRIPFLNAVFSNALFIYLYREPRDNISSIMEAWKSGHFVTYKQLPGWDGPWSLLLSPAWRTLTDSPLPERAAFQWKSANQYIMDDLDKLSTQRWTTVRYEDFVEDPAAETERLCRFADIEFDDRLRKLMSSDLPLSRYTLTKPASDKWRANAEALEQVLPTVEKLRQKAQKIVAQHKR